ncbi:MAG: response regulator [Chloroflexi bacterium]|nr:response regulator [Chloroflexota bacterium]
MFFDMAVHVLIIGFQNDIRSSLLELFTNEQYQVAEELDSGGAVLYVMQRNPSVIVMPEDMPPLEGVELLPLVRRLTRAPIVVVGEGGEAAVVRALLQGADMYLRMPFNYRELLSRVRALIRRSDQGSGGMRSVDDINLLDQLPPELRPAYPLDSSEALIDQVIRNLGRPDISGDGGRLGRFLQGLAGRIGALRAPSFGYALDRFLPAMLPFPLLSA